MNFLKDARTLVRLFSWLPGTLNSLKVSVSSPASCTLSITEAQGRSREALSESRVSQTREPTIREQLLNGTYQPQPQKRVEISKLDGGVRKHGIPIVLDRFIQQALLQVLQRDWDQTFSENGFRQSSYDKTSSCLLSSWHLNWGTERKRFPTGAFGASGDHGGSGLYRRGLPLGG